RDLRTGERVRGAVRLGELRGAAVRRRVVHPLHDATEVGGPGVPPTGGAVAGQRGRSSDRPRIISGEKRPPAERERPLHIMAPMLRILTAGESHGPGLAVI